MSENIVQDLLSAETQLNNLLKVTHELKSSIGSYQGARESLNNTAAKVDGLLAAANDVLAEEKKIVQAIRESAPEKVLASMAALEAATHEIRAVNEKIIKEIDALDEEFISVKDTLISSFSECVRLIEQRIAGYKSEIVTLIRESSERHQLAVDKLFVADEKILLTQEHIKASLKQIEEARGTLKKIFLTTVIGFLGLFLISAASFVLLWSVKSAH
jgi:hypothetical protein